MIRGRRQLRRASQQAQRLCEAFARDLTASGFDGGMYYQID